MNFSQITLHKKFVLCLALFSSFSVANGDGSIFSYFRPCLSFFGLKVTQRSASSAGSLNVDLTTQANHQSGPRRETGVLSKLWASFSSLFDRAWHNNGVASRAYANQIGQENIKRLAAANETERLHSESETNCLSRRLDNSKDKLKKHNKGLANLTAELGAHTLASQDNQEKQHNDSIFALDQLGQTIKMNQNRSAKELNNCDEKLSQETFKLSASFETLRKKARSSLKRVSKEHQDFLNQVGSLKSNNQEATDKIKQLSDQLAEAEQHKTANKILLEKLNFAETKLINEANEARARELNAKKEALAAADLAGLFVLSNLPIPDKEAQKTLDQMGYSLAPQNAHAEPSLGQQHHATNKPNEPRRRGDISKRLQAAANKQQQQQT